MVPNPKNPGRFRESWFCRTADRRTGKLNIKKVLLGKWFDEINN